MDVAKKKDFLERVIDTRKNEEGVRSATDHLSRLREHIEALRKNGVSWHWITCKFNAGREDGRPITVSSLRTLWARLDKREHGESATETQPETSTLAEESGALRLTDSDWLTALVKREDNRERRQGRN